MELLLYLAPGLALQLFTGWALLVLFSQKHDKVAVFLPPLTALLFVGLSVGIEWVLSPFLFQGTLVLQWALFVLLAHKLCRIPLAKSMLALFCYFALLLGSGLLESTRGDAHITEEERRLLEDFDAREVAAGDGIPDWAHRIEFGLLPNRLLAVRRDFQDVVYGNDDPADPTDVPTPSPAVDPGSFAANPPSATPAPAAPGGMTGAAFEALVYSDDPPAPLPEPGDFTAPPAPPPGALPVRADYEPELIGSPTSITSDQMSEIVEVRNRSTDRSYAAPDYEIGAVSMGDNGRFAMVNGRLVREGGILRTGGQDPRGWKLYKVTPTELFWQPLR